MAAGFWNSTTANAPWPGGTVPSSTDDVVIRPGDTVTVTASATINSITFANTATSTGTVSVNSGQILTVTGSIVQQNAASAPSRAGGSNPVRNRYRDAYLVARATAAIGAVVKAVGIGLGCLIAIVAVIMGSQTGGGPQFFFGGLLLGVIVGIPIYVLGVLVSAHAQVLKATLDTAVHSSPFLTKDEMARVTSL